MVGSASRIWNFCPSREMRSACRLTLTRRAWACATRSTWNWWATPGHAGRFASSAEARKRRGFLEDYQDRMKNWNELMEKRGTRPDMPMKPQVVTHTLNQLPHDDAIVSSDSGTIATWTARYLKCAAT